MPFPAINACSLIMFTKVHWDIEIWKCTLPTFICPDSFDRSFVATDANSASFLMAGNPIAPRSSSGTIIRLCFLDHLSKVPENIYCNQKRKHWKHPKKQSLNKNITHGRYRREQLVVNVGNESKECLALFTVGLGFWLRSLAQTKKQLSFE